MSAAGFSPAGPSAAHLPGRFGVWIAIASAAVWLVDLLLLRGGTPHPLDDTWEYGLVAQQLLAGYGFRTPMIHPPLWTLHDPALTVPVMVHGPLLPLIGAPLLALFGAAALDHAAWLAATFATIAAVCTARAVGRAAGPVAGVMAAALVTLSPLMLRMVHHDIAPVAGACAVAVAMDLLARSRPRAFIAGLVLGAGALVRPELLFAAVAGGAVAGRARLGAFAVGAAIALVPWWLHGFVIGAPGFNLSSYLLIAYTPSHPGLSPLWDFAITPALWPAALATALPELPGKWLHLAPRAIRHALMAPGPWLGLAAMIGLAAALRAPETRRWGRAALGVSLIPIALVTLTEPSERYVAVFLPLWIAGVVHAVSMAESLRRRNVIFVALLMWMLPFSLSTWKSERNHSAALRDWFVLERRALVSRMAPERAGSLMFSDTPDFVAWTTGRPVIATTLDRYRTWRVAAGDVASMPRRGETHDEWFHTDVHAAPAPTPGGSAADAGPH